MALRTKGEIRGRGRGARSHDAGLREPRSDPRAGRGRRRNRRRPQRHVQHLHGERDRGCGRGCARRQAWEPRRELALRVGGRARGARRHDRPRRGRRRACLAEAGIAFLFAPMFHPAMAHAGPVRRELRVPTVFNFLGPLTNPARPFAQAVGCSDARMLPLMAEVLARRGTRAVLFRGGRARRAHHVGSLDRLHGPRRLGDRGQARPDRARLRSGHGRGSAGRRRRRVGRDRSVGVGRGGRTQARCRAPERRRGARGRRTCPDARRWHRARGRDDRFGAATAALDRWVAVSGERVASAPDDPVRSHPP